VHVPKEHYRVQARKLTRLTSALTCVSALLAAVLFSMAVLLRNIIFVVPGLWFGMHGTYAYIIYKQVRAHAPPLHGEMKGNVLAWLLLVGSLLAGCTMSGNTWPPLASAKHSRLMFLFQHAVSKGGFWLSFTTCSYGCGTALAMLYSNGERPVCPRLSDKHH
jgi:hypothetical protein